MSAGPTCDGPERKKRERLSPPLPDMSENGESGRRRWP